MKNIQRFIKPFYFKMIVAMVLSFLVVQYTRGNVFIADSPRLRLPIQDLAMEQLELFVHSTKDIAYKILPFGSKLREKDIADGPETIKNKYAVNSAPFSIVVKGVYAQEVKNVTKYTFKENEIEWVEYTYHVNGKEIKIKMPKGSEPSQEALENIYK